MPTSTLHHDVLAYLKCASLLRGITDSPMFQNRSFQAQVLVFWQLLVTMANLGMLGNGGQSPIISDLMIVSEGSVDNYTNRWIYAIMQLQSSCLELPTTEEWKEIKSATGLTSFLKDCVGFIDGALMPLAYAPQKNLVDYYSHKSFYAVKSIIICDHH
ncbi:hypothetical protein CROQUDRAFT_36771 [Cronartium quercuum f. sp. fusiforme G11]|uniref:Uncharacterized protein n=1 Tax=Cronartium quercuum f. sp. fusiforme G11 TaxID=708437 RepID=A0A9P6NW59_9BASI|nr:hypothetical protein CROQUDRAFT_36771 [Cronartium quercuum f. sp. fusiforme G11]